VIRRALARAVCGLALAAACAAPASAQDTDRSLEDLAQQKLNPLAQEISLVANVSFGFGFGPRHDVQPSLTFQPVIPLPSGGYLFIERTEAMTIIDVNTGKSVGKTNLEATVTNTNLEAAREVARQLRLRDIGGIIVIDFIDMLLEKNKSQVETAMKEALAVDKTRSQVFEIGPLGLMQVTRKRVSGGLVESFSETCPTCEGRGILVNYEA